MKVLSIEQMTKLKELGVAVKPKGTCLMYTSDSSDNYYLKYGESTCEDDVVAFGLQDIIDILPKEIIKEGDRYCLVIANDSYYCSIMYLCWKNCNDIIEFAKQLALDSAYKILLWVIKNGYLTAK